MMKNLALVAVLALLSIGGFAQDNKMWIGGTLKSQSSGSEGNKEKEFVFAPEFGYNLNERWAIGAGIIFGSTEDEGEDWTTNSTFFAPFARYTFAKTGKFDFYLNGALALGSYKEEDQDNDVTYKSNLTSFGINPGVSFHFSPKFAAELRMPNLLYFYSFSGDREDGGHYLGINDDYTIQNYLLDASIGFIYKF
jgi:hypothetical protein